MNKEAMRRDLAAIRRERILNILSTQDLDYRQVHQILAVNDNSITPNNVQMILKYLQGLKQVKIIGGYVKGKRSLWAIRPEEPKVEYTALDRLFGYCNATITSKPSLVFTEKQYQAMKENYPADVTTSRPKAHVKGSSLGGNSFMLGAW